MPHSPRFFIAHRVYDILKCIYKERVTIISAPDGYGKSATIKEFVRRSRPDGLSCRFITDARNANDCFRRICKLALGYEVPIPTTAADYNNVKRLFSSLRPEKELLIVADCPSATDMLLGNLYCTHLFLEFSPIHLVLSTDEMSYFHSMLVYSSNIRTITEKDLAFTEADTVEYLATRNISHLDAAELHRNTEGKLAKLGLCMILIKRNEPVVSYELNALIKQAVIDNLDRSQQFAALCAAALENIDDKTLQTLNAEPALCDHYGSSAMTREAIFQGIRDIGVIMPMVHLNERTGSWTCQKHFRLTVYEHFLELPQPVRSALHRCSALQFLRDKKTYRAFCQYYLSGDIYAAAIPQQDEKISFELLMKSKDFLLEFAENCPLDCKPILPRMLRILALLMLTPYRDRIKHRFDEAIEYISTSDTYTGAERRNMLCYAYALRTYEDFYLIEKMGNHIKRAYDLFSGTSIGHPPFFSWGLYAPSIFSLIHHFHLPISTEAEQFARYHSMYTEMIHHGEHVVDLYNAEIFYFTGDPENALPRAQEVVRKCTRDLYLPTKIGALNTIGKSALMLGLYDIFTDCTTQLADIIKRYSTTELGDMAALCLALLCCFRNGTDEDIWRVTSTRDEEVLLNRYTAPFYFKVRCYAMISHGEYRMMLHKASYYLQACDDVRSETIALSIKMSAAIAHFTLGEKQSAMAVMDEVLSVIAASGVIMPAVEEAILYPLIFEEALEQLPQHGKVLSNILGKSTVMRRNMTTVRTRELTDLDLYDASTKHLSDSLSASLSALEPYRHKLGLTRDAMKYSLYASRGFSNEQIAEICNTSVNSVKSSLKRTYAKLGIRSRGQLRHILNIND